MKACFVDTSGWAMLANDREPHHLAAARFRDAWMRSGGIFVSTDYVLDETLTLLRARLGIERSRLWWDQISASARIRWEAVSAERAARAREWFFRWTDHDFSLTDCSSFVVMRDLGLRSALTTDRHFSIAGFETEPVPVPVRGRSGRPTSR